MLSLQSTGSRSWLKEQISTMIQRIQVVSRLTSFTEPLYLQKSF